MGHVSLKRVYTSAEESDGYRILVDRLWPRGLSKDKARIDHWLKDIAPSPELRKWFGHDPVKWKEFQERYRKELQQKPNLVEWLKKKTHEGKVTLLFAACDEAHNNAVALKAFLKV